MKRLSASKASFPPIHLFDESALRALTCRDFTKGSLIDLGIPKQLPQNQSQPKTACFFFLTASLLYIPYPSISLILTHIKPEFEYRTFHFFLLFPCLTLTSIPCPYHRTLSRVRSIFSRSVFSLFYFVRMGFVACVAPVPVQMSDRNFDM